MNVHRMRIWSFAVRHKIQPQQFNMLTYWRNNCGCAAGHLAMIFPSQWKNINVYGSRLFIHNDLYYPSLIENKSEIETLDCSSVVIDIATFFDISNEDVSNIVMSASYDEHDENDHLTQDIVADRIDAIIRKNGYEPNPPDYDWSEAESLVFEYKNA